MKRDRGIVLGGVLAVLFGLAAPAAAQGPERKIVVRPSDERKTLLDEMPTRPIDTTAVLPAPELLATRGLAPVARIHVTRIVLDGGTVLTKAEVQRIVAPYEGRDVTIEELQDVRRQLSEEYVRRGYVTSGVVLPDQEVVQGAVVLRHVGGKLAAIHVTGNGHLNAGYVRDRIQAAADTPLRVQDLQDALELLQQDPLIRRVNARLTPGLQPGEVGARGHGAAA